MASELRPCPFHNDRKPILIYVGEGPSSIIEFAEDYRDGEPGCAMCDCGACGPTDYSFDGIIAAWNSRVDPVKDALAKALEVVRHTMICQNYKKHIEMVDAALTQYQEESK
jgi:hypothetical protein